MEYNEKDIIDVSVAYHLLMEQQKEILGMTLSDDYLDRKRAVEKMRERVRGYECVTNEELRKGFRGRGVQLEMIHSMCKNLLKPSSRKA